MKVSGALVVVVLGSLPPTAAAQSPADGWSGQVQCVISVRGIGYQDDQTHTWVLSGAPITRNDFRDYPATWTVTGGGSRTPVSQRAAQAGVGESWTRSGSDATASITLFVPVGTNTMRIAGGQRAVRAPGGLRVTPAPGDVDEFRFQYIDIADGARQTSLTGSRPVTRTDLVGLRQPPGSTATENCTWNLSKNGTAPGNKISGGRAPGGLAAAGAITATALSTSLTIEQTIPELPDVSVASRLVAGGSAVIALRVRNGGTSPVEGVTVSFAPPKGLSVQQLTCSLPACPSAAQLESGWTVALPSSATATVMMLANVAPSTTSLTLTASASAPPGVVDTNPADNSTTLTASVVPSQADLAVMLDSLPKSAAARFMYRVTVKNRTGVGVVDAILKVPAPKGIEHLSVTCRVDPTQSQSGGEATCPDNPSVAQIERGLPIPRLDRFRSVSFSIVALPRGSATTTLSASVTPPSNVSETAPADNTASASISLSAATQNGNTDLSVDIIPPKAGSRGVTFLQYSVLVRNRGQAGADGAVIRIPAVEGIHALSVSCSIDLTRYDKAEPLVCPEYVTLAAIQQGVAIPRFPPGSSGTFEIYAVATASGQITLPAHIDAAPGFADPLLQNNSASTTVPTIGLAPAGRSDLRVSIASYRPNIQQQAFGFNIVVRNDGPDDAHLAVVKVPLVAGASVMRLSCESVADKRTNAAQCPSNLTAAALAAGIEMVQFSAGTQTRFNIELTTPPVTGSTVTMSAGVASPPGGTDPDPSNNSASVIANAQLP